LRKIRIRASPSGVPRDDQQFPEILSFNTPTSQLRRSGMRKPGT
jgi:hypothetical protein